MILMLIVLDLLKIVVQSTDIQSVSLLTSWLSCGWLIGVCEASSASCIINTDSIPV